MNKQQFGYKLGKLYLKFNGFIQQKAERYKLPLPFVYFLMYAPVVFLFFFFFTLFFIVVALILGLKIMMFFVSNATLDEAEQTNADGTRYGDEGYGYYDKNGRRIF
ncbi:hypothetical protein [Aggregatibacter actinomycetemcomitans]|uniref:hypothetical protein n=1 Tax=Aggregatibacter actinomycetemcomitans TaxID=714 RepID=UPI0011D82078|nr:hypothetical protein [Aggregatibacter actinomycetemcomitans]TYA49279.1 hypothetical protein FXB74_05170 [Aggregatibacter actinomycetemcomitans]